jgi:cell division protein FtsB
MQETSRKRMLKIAWALEYMAAFIGLAIGAAIVFATIRKELTTETLIAASVGALPLVMVAAAELCKIPMVRSIMNAKRWWGSMVAAILLIGACGLTFETVFNGLERQWAVRSLQIDEAKAEVANIHEKIAQMSNAVNDLNEPRLAQIEELKRERSATEDRIKELDNKLASEIEGHNKRYQICVSNKRPGCVSGGKFVAGYKADHAKAMGAV